MPQIDMRFLLSKAGTEGRIEKTESGAINDIVIFSQDGKKSVLRCRTREDIFG